MRWPLVSATIIAATNGWASVPSKEAKSRLRAARASVSRVSFVMSRETSTGPSSRSQYSKSSLNVSSMTGW